MFAAVAGGGRGDDAPSARIQRCTRIARGRRGRRWPVRHLAQGAPTSPALANLAAYRLDARLSGLARKLDAVYTRYADDLAFSGGDRLRRFAKRLQTLVAVIAFEEGFAVNFRKCRFMPASVRQELAGVVVNAKTNGRREDFDTLKAILTNCRRRSICRGSASPNRENPCRLRNHLLGRIAHWTRLQPERRTKLPRITAVRRRIEWPEQDAGHAESPSDAPTSPRR